MIYCLVVNNQVAVDIKFLFQHVYVCALLQRLLVMYASIMLTHLSPWLLLSGFFVHVHAMELIDSLVTDRERTSCEWH
jgi:hypothetical protein